MDATFRLSKSFLNRYQDVQPKFGFQGLGELVYNRTYSRIKADGENEVWWETVQRVVEGCYRMQERHIQAYNLGWDTRRAQRSAQEMYSRIFDFRFLPPGRGLWAMGSELTEERGIYAALNNCGFRSTRFLSEQGADPFCFVMDASMLGIGVGFDVWGAHQLEIKKPKKNDGWLRLMIADSREGWVDSLRAVLMAYFHGDMLPVLDYSQIRPAGVPIKGFGGVASGPESLREMHQAIIRILDQNVGYGITETTISDIMNLIGRCVVAGNVRRTALINFGSPYSEEFLGLKDYQWDAKEGRYTGRNAYRSEWGWTSNNSVDCDLGMDYTKVAAQTAKNGEPGYMWLENMRRYGRMVDPPNDKDMRVLGGNPCLEQSLEDSELCCLVETYPANHDTMQDFHRTLKYAYLYAKTVTLGQTHWPETNRVMLRNRRIGTSMSGIQQFVARTGIETLKTWCESGYHMLGDYDRTYSEWFCVPRSIKMTSIKPSGTVSLLAGATPGMHWPESLFYIRRMRLSIHSSLLQPLKRAGFTLEPCVGSEDTTLVVNVPVRIDNEGGKLRTVADVSMWEQLNMAAFLQRYWADNQVSSTVTFDPVREGPQIAAALTYHQYNLKGISLLPRTEAGQYAQMPYEAVSEELYNLLIADLRSLSFDRVKGEEADVERFCSNDGCAL